ncbi:MAG: phage protease [Sphingobium sp.]|nr:phage protease [Sphingobium sp.]
MTKPLIALCSALALSADADGAPEWVHLCPAGEIRTRDGRGPYRIVDPAQVIAASLQAGEKLVLDDNHATDLAAPEGRAAPARGWIVELQARENGVWGRVEWTEAGRHMVESREYRGISPVIGHHKDGRVAAILRASLVNQPNFLGLTALHQEESMDFRKWLIEALGLDSTADDAAIQAALKAKIGGNAEVEVESALQSALAPIGTALGLSGDVTAATVLAGVQQLKDVSAKDADARVTALQSEVVTLTTDLKTLRDDGRRKDAAAFVDKAIAAGRVGVKAARDEYISMHMEDAGRAEKLVNAMPIVAAGALLTGQHPGEHHADGTDDPVQIAAHATQYQKDQGDKGISISFAAAVRAVQEGRHK